MYLYILNDTRENYLKHFMFIKDLKEFRKYLQYLSDCDNINLARNVNSAMISMVQIHMFMIMK